MSVLESPLLFPADGAPGVTGLVLLPDGDRLPLIAWLGTLTPHAAAEDLVAVADPGPDAGLLVEHARGSFRRPHLRGHRIDAAAAAGGAMTGSAWSPLFTVASVDADPRRIAVEARDDAAGLELSTEIESLVGGALRVRHVLTNAGATPYLLEGLDVGVPLSDRAVEMLDFTGRHEGERAPQRQPVRDGLWLRENRRGRTSLESATVLAAGEAGFGFQTGRLVGVHVAFSGNSAMWIARDPYGPPTIGGGELLLPGELLLAPGERYLTPWLFVVAGDAGLDSLAAPLHAWQRSLPTHPPRQPVTLNVWEAVYFDHDLHKLTALAERAAGIGVERFVLDDGWFAGRRDDSAGLGDWAVDPAVWPAGLHPLVEHVRRLGMQFGLWFEPEMVNPDSELYRAHRDWILRAGGRVPPLARNQLVLDLANPAVFDYLLGRLDALLAEYPIDYVKWDHNRDLLDAGSSDSGAPGVHRQALAHYALLDELRVRHPDVEWESCASGGGRIDLGVLERVERFWTSDLTDALARQAIQRWTSQLIAPEYLGSHVSAGRSHQTGRVLPLDFRAGTSLFGSFGLEVDLTALAPDEMAALAEWIRRYRQWRPLLHAGRVVRVASGDPVVWVHGVVAPDRRSALFAHVQLDESVAARGVRLRMPGLLDDVGYDLRWAGPVDVRVPSRAAPLDPAGPSAGRPVRGLVLARDGVLIPRRPPESILLIAATAR